MLVWTWKKKNIFFLLFTRRAQFWFPSFFFRWKLIIEGPQKRKAFHLKVYLSFSLMEAEHKRFIDSWLHFGVDGSFFSRSIPCAHAVNAQHHPVLLWSAPSLLVAICTGHFWVVMKELIDITSFSIKSWRNQATHTHTQKNERQTPSLPLKGSADSACSWLKTFT